MVDKKIYLDYAATTPVDPEVVLAMEPYWDQKFGNAGSLHAYGQEAVKAVDDAREIVKDFLGASALREIIFTGSATEANNILIQGVLNRFSFRNGKKVHAITTAIEHPSVLEPFKKMEVKGLADVTYIKPDKKGIIDPEEIGHALRPETVLVSVGYANNEIGTIQDIPKISEVIRNFRNVRDVINVQNVIADKAIKRAKASDRTIRTNISSLPYFHTDAVQATNFLEMDIGIVGVDALTLSGHKIYGPKGIGVLYKKEDLELEPIIYGGGQEYGIRPSTQNVPLIVGLARALRLVGEDAKKNIAGNIKEIRDYALQKIHDVLPSAELNGSKDKRLPNNINISIKGEDAQVLLIGLSEKGVCVSSGAACFSRAQKPSHVIRALGKTEQEARGSLRITLGRSTSKEDINRFIDSLSSLIHNRK